MIRVLVVDDSVVAREFLRALFDDDPSLIVVCVATSGSEAIEMAQRHRPDVITVDIHMSGMDGFETTRRIMASCPTPIVMVTGSSAGREMANSFRALEAGALALTARPPGPGHPDHALLVAELLTCVKAMAEVKVVRRRGNHGTPPAPRLPEALPAATRGDVRLVAIGASTGGPAAIQSILAALPGDFGAPLLIAQHMYNGFTEGFVEWLGRTTPLKVHLAADGVHPSPGAVYVAPAGSQLTVGPGERLSVCRAESNALHAPSVTLLFESAARVLGPRAVGVLLTGMGDDGALGLKSMRDRGALTICQDEATAPLFGMPNVAIQLGAAALTLPPDQIARELARVIGERTTHDAAG